MTWLYNQSTGELTHERHVATGYSGHGEGRNNPAMESIGDTGPLPVGSYTIGAAFTHPTCGPIAMQLFPDVSNAMHGRSGFLIHGDNAAHDASHGCMIFDRTTRLAIAADADRRLSVISGTRNGAST